MSTLAASRMFTAYEANTLLKHRAPSIPRDEVADYTTQISSALDDGEIDAAVDTFRAWLTREARYASHGHEANLGELVETMLGLIGWMHERVPRSLVRTAALAA